MTDIYPAPEGFFVTTLSSDLTSSATTVSLSAVPSNISKGYMVIEPSHATKREVVHFTSVGANSVTCADDDTDGSDATGRGCLGSVTQGANTAHDQGVTVLIAAVEQYWARAYTAFTAEHSVSGSHTTDSIAEKTGGSGVTVDGVLLKDGGITLGASGDIKIGADGASVNDTSGNEIIALHQVASAANYLAATNATTSDPVIIEAKGDGADVGLTIKAKGDGVLKPSPITYVAQIIDGATSISTGDGKFYFTIPAELDGYNLTGIHLKVVTAGTGSSTTAQLHNLTDTSDMLSTPVMIDDGEVGSDTSGVPAVVDTSNDDVVEHDLLRLDIDTVSSTAPAGLIAKFTFALP